MPSCLAELGRMTAAHAAGHRGSCRSTVDQDNTGSTGNIGELSAQNSNLQHTEAFADSRQTAAAERSCTLYQRRGSAAYWLYESSVATC